MKEYIIALHCEGVQRLWLRHYIKNKGGHRITDNLPKP